MLEKIGLPSKPSMRGGNWVVDASHCQGCSQQFTFINRKHHCRRCGGLFCNGCTQQRMILRSQGDSAVRICDPCKKIEEAARFELRYGHKNRGTKSNTKPVAKNEDELLKELLDADDALASKSMMKSRHDKISDLRRDTGSSSSSRIQDLSSYSESGENIIKGISTAMDNNVVNEVFSNSPEELRKLAVEEKSKYKLLKAEGKSGEALAAFKRGKELEKQAAALENAIRKSQRLASVKKSTENHDDVIDKKRVSVNTSKGGKDDLTNELRELGWSDADLHDADKKQEPLTLEGELSSIIREIPQKSHSGHAPNDIDRSQVVSLKKKALLLKREGKLAEAKEELRRAKIMEKQLEEQELLAGAEDSDDELSALIRSMDADKNENLLPDSSEPGINFDALTDLGDDFGGNFDVTDDDMNDPEMTAALKSFGWNEEDDNPTETVLRSSADKVSQEVLSLKKEAVIQKRAGNMADARELLRKAKLLEKDLVVSEDNIQEFDPSLALNSSAPQFSEKATTAMRHSEENVATTDVLEYPRPKRSKLAIQKELLAVKRKALALRREGRTEEADEELRKGKNLEQQLEEMETPQKFAVSKGNPDANNNQVCQSLKPASMRLGLVEEADDSEVTEQDMQDPTLLSVLENLGWKDDLESSKKSKPTAGPSETDSTTKLPVKPKKSKGELQRELLGIKRKALALRRQGKTEEAEEELKKAKGLEDQLAELDSVCQVDSLAKNGADGFVSSIPEKKLEIPLMSQNNLETDMPGDNKLKMPIKDHLIDRKNDLIACLSKDSDGPTPALKQVKARAETKNELPKIERKSLGLRGQGQVDESTEELNQSKDLEIQHVKMEAEQPFCVTENSSDKLNLLTAGKEPENLASDQLIKKLHEHKGIGAEMSGGSLSNLSVELPTTSSNVEDGPFSKPKMDETISIIPLSSQALKVDDLLPGDEKNGIPFPVKKHNLITDTSDTTFIDSGLRLDNQPTSVQTGISCQENLSNFQDYASGMVPKKTAGVQSLGEELDAAKGLHSTKDQVLELKRKAVALKKEGRMAEALAELKQAKLLEKGLGESSHKENVTIRTEPVNLVDHASSQTSKKVSSPPQKPMSSRDRFKLQQESLAHKRRALQLRREGKMEEAESLTELAKKLEAQIQEADGTSTNIVGNKEDESLVEDFLDPQLMLALKAIGWEEKDIISHAPTPKSADEPKNMTSRSRMTNPAQQVKHSVNTHAVSSELQARKGSSSTDMSVEKAHLEEQIKSEKLRALNLKRGGRQSDALEALRSAKRLEKRLASLSS